MPLNTPPPLLRNGASSPQSISVGERFTLLNAVGRTSKAFGVEWQRVIEDGLL